MNVFQKINEVKKVVKTLTKDAETSGKGAYSFVSGAQILSLIKDKMEEIGLLFLPVETESRGWKTFNYKNSYGDEKTDFIVEGKLVYEWINCDEPSDRQRVLFDYYGQQNDVSKAFGSALTYSERYLLLKSLGAPTDEDDPDNKTESKREQKATPDGKKGDSNPPPSNGNKSQGNNKGARQRSDKSKYAQVVELIKDSELKLNDVTDWIVKQFGSNIRINNLTDEQFNTLMKALRKHIKEEDE